MWFRSADIVATCPGVELQERGRGDAHIPYLLDSASVIFHAYSAPSPWSIHRIKARDNEAAAVVASAAGADMAVPFTFCITNLQVICGGFYCGELYKSLCSGTKMTDARDSSAEGEMAGVSRAVPCRASVHPCKL